MTAIEALIQIALLAGTSFITFIFTKKKYNAETNTIEISNINESLKIYVNIISDLEARVEKLQSKILDMEVIIDRLKDENKSLKEVKCKFPEDPLCK